MPFTLVCALRFPLRCPGCYAYGDDHLGGDLRLRELRDFKGQALVDGVLELVERHNPLHLSIVGGEPLVLLLTAQAAQIAGLAAGHGFLGSGGEGEVRWWIEGLRCHRDLFPTAAALGLRRRGLAWRTV